MMTRLLVKKTSMIFSTPARRGGPATGAVSAGNSGAAPTVVPSPAPSPGKLGALQDQASAKALSHELSIAHASLAELRSSLNLAIADRSFLEAALSERDRLMEDWARAIAEVVCGVPVCALI